MKRLTASLNKLLNAANLELRPRGQTIQALSSYPKLVTTGKVLEFIGAQGVGKSTLNNDLHKFLKDNWFFRADLGQIGPSENSLTETEQLHRDIYFRKLRRLKKKQRDPWRSITTARQMSRVISESLTILTNEFPRGFVLDESLFKNFPREVLKLAADSSVPLWENRAFVYLRARNPDFAVARYQGRVLERSSRGLPQRRYSDAEVRAMVERDNGLFDRILEKAQAFDCPTIVVYAEDVHQENIEKILDFEKTLRTELWTHPEQGASRS